MFGVRPIVWTGSGDVFDPVAGVLIFEFCGAELTAPLLAEARDLGVVISAA